MKLGILGAGGIAKSMCATVRGMHANGEDVELWAVASRDKTKADAFANREGVRYAYGSYEAMLEDDQIDLVYVATPHAFHAEQMLSCIDHGKAVLCEKSFTGNLKQAEEVFRHAEEKGVLVTEAIWTRYMPSRTMIRDVLDTGEIGDVVALTANLGYAISGVERIIRPELAGGALLDVGVYCLNFASMVMGNDLTGMEAAGVRMPNGMDLQDSMTLHYRSGAMADLLTTALCQTDRMGVIYGTEGYIRVENINNPSRVEIWHPSSSSLFPSRVLPVPKQITGYEYEIRACMEALKCGDMECTAMPHHETLTIMGQMDAVREKLGVVYPFD